MSALVEGNSVRATARMVGVEHKTVLRVLSRAGDRCAQVLNGRMRNMPGRMVQFAWYNFCPIHEALHVAPAMASGVADHLRDAGELVSLLEAEERPEGAA